jgi:hypothetical protein
LRLPPQPRPFDLRAGEFRRLLKGGRGRSKSHLVGQRGGLDPPEGLMGAARGVAERLDPPGGQMAWLGGAGYFGVTSNLLGVPWIPQNSLGGLDQASDSTVGFWS